MATDIDRLFRESLDQVEMQPSAAAWDQVQNRIAGKKAPWFWVSRVAAAILLLLASAWIFWSLRPESSNIGPIATIDKPEPLVFEYEWNIPAFAKVEKEITIQIASVKEQSAVQKEKQALPMAFEMIALESIKTTSWPQPESNITIDLGHKQTLKEEPTIKITYLATNTADTLKTNKLNEIIAFLKNESPTELLADIRDLKDNLLNKN